MYNDLRKKIVTMITRAGEGHIPSSFSIVDIIATLYDHHLRIDPSNPEWEDRDCFVLSKGHGCAALYVVLAEHGFISQHDLDSYGSFTAMLGGHPDRTKIPGAEASTGSLGHGLPYSIGIALGFRIRRKQKHHPKTDYDVAFHCLFHYFRLRSELHQSTNIYGSSQAPYRKELCRKMICLYYHWH